MTYRSRVRTTTIFHWPSFSPNFNDFWGKGGKF